MNSKYDIQYLADDHLWSFHGLPCKIVRPRSKPLQVHLNFFLNLASRIRQNKLKKDYTKLLDDYLLPIPKSPYNGTAKLLYVYYAPNKAIRDLDNMTAIIMKCTNDTLVQRGFIVDDNTSCLLYTSPSPRD